MDKPIRVQRKRTKGFRLPPNTKCVCRPTKWGNPFRAVQEDGLWWVKDGEGNYWDAPHSGKYSAVSVCVRLYEAWIEGKIGIKEVDLSELKGKNLACFCSIINKNSEYTLCHADILLSLANEIPLKQVEDENIKNFLGEKS